MGLFPSANDFKAGRGVEKDAPRKTGIGRFFELVGRDMNGMFLANLLTCIGFLPVICLVYIGFLANSLPVMLLSAAAGGILAGPALAGMYDTVLRALRDEAGYWWMTYRRAFKRNFRASIVPGIFYCVVVTMQIFLVYFCFNMLSRGTNVGVPLWVATVLNLLVFQMLFAYLWPQIVLLEQPLQPDREKQHQLHDRVPAPRTGGGHRADPVLGRGDPVHAAGAFTDDHLRLLVHHRGILPDHLRRHREGVPHRGKHPQNEGCRIGGGSQKGLRP